jgi:quercetin dioxygenase-like cupin family protein
MISRPADYKVEELDWGTLTWFTAKALGNSETMTIGKCLIKPGQSNPRHYHPNCDEVLHVLQGDIIHSLGDEEVEMSAGDTISIPANIVHHARNNGQVEAVVLICFSSAERQMRIV